MKKSLATLCLALSGTVSTLAFSEPCNTTITKASSDPGVFFGITYAFGNKNELGFTLQATSSRRDDQGIIAAGVSYYPATGKVGIPLGLGYQKSHALVLGGYDLLLKSPVLHGGYTNSSMDRRAMTCGEGDVGESDVRLKHDIYQVAVLKNGLKIYSFRYKSRDGVFVGVMAQDLLANPQFSSAVIRREDGHYLVNYRTLGIRMTTLESWNKNGESAILRSQAEIRS